MAKFGKEIIVRTTTGIFFVAVVVGAILLGRWAQWTLAGAIVILGMVELRKLLPRNWWWVGIFYIMFPMFLFGMFGEFGDWDRYLLLATITTVWVNDIFAYLIGVAFGRHPLWKRISPKKSWEGFVGGLIFGTAYAWAVGKYCFGATGFWFVLAWILIILAAVAGDLFESWLKRRVGVKDSGNLFPGHGGILDRFDALLFALPVAYAYFLAIAMATD